MVAFWMREFAPAQAAGRSTFDRNQLSCRKISPLERTQPNRRRSVRPRALQVLVVNHQRDAADKLAQRIGHWGHVARPTYDGFAALKLAAVEPWDVVILKAAMPLMDGSQVARQLRLGLRGNDCLIIALAGPADDEIRTRCVEARIDLVLTLPVEPAVIETLLMLECALVNRSLKAADFAASRVLRRAPKTP